MKVMKAMKEGLAGDGRMGDGASFFHAKAPYSAGAANREP